MLASLLTLGAVGAALTSALIVVLVRRPLRKERVTCPLLLKASNEVPKGCRSIHVCNRRHDC